MGVFRAVGCGVVYGLLPGGQGMGGKRVRHRRAHGVRGAELRRGAAGRARAVQRSVGG